MKIWVMKNQVIGVMRMTTGRATITQSRKDTPAPPVTFCMMPIATTLKELPAGVAMPPVTAATGMPIMRQRPRLDLRGFASAALRIVSAKPMNKTVQGTSDMIMDTMVVAIMKPSTSLRVLLPVHLRSAFMRRTPQLVFIMMTGSENTAMMKNSGGLAKPPMAPPRLGTTPSTGHSTTMSSAVTPRGSAEVIHKATRANSRPKALAPSADSASLPGMKQDTMMQIAAMAMPIRRFGIDTFVLSTPFPPLILENRYFSLLHVLYNPPPLQPPSSSLIVCTSLRKS